MTSVQPAAANRRFAAVDLGATSGRVILGRIAGGKLETQQVARFANEPVRLGNGLHWNLAGLYGEVLAGLAAAEHAAPGQIESVGIDSWAVDYGLFRRGRLLGEPFHYRDERNERGVEAVHGRFSPQELYARNGLQHLSFNTLFQLATEGDMLEFSDRLLLIPDLVTYWLTGVEVAERTNASTTGLLDPRTGEWDGSLARGIGVPERILPRLVDPGTRVGQLSPAAAERVGRPLDVMSVASHDTASAVAAVPALRPDFAYVSCGTWGLVGLELATPVLTEDARRANFTNEGGLDGQTRFLHNVMGMWLLSESIRFWHPLADAAERATVLHALLGEAERVTGDRPVFDVNDSRFLAPGDIPERIANWYRERGERAPANQAEVVRCIIESLAQAFTDAVFRASELASHTVGVIHIVGGGSQNALLCQATANRSGLPVLAGPTEATAMGNLLVQARALGEIEPGPESIRAVVARSTEVTEYLPR